MELNKQYVTDQDITRAQQHMNAALDVSAFLGHPKPTTYIEEFLGVTGWKLTRDDPPDYLGWYRVRMEGTPDPSASQHLRYWNGAAWSACVHRSMDDDLVNIKSQYFLDQHTSESVIWCGLKKPHMVGYFNPLVLSARAQRYVEHHSM